MTWQPIDTAPKDGTVVDLFCASGRMPDCRWEGDGLVVGWRQRYTDTAGDWFDVSDMKPTHWMHRPANPCRSRATTADEARSEFLSAVRCAARHWARQTPSDDEASADPEQWRCNSVAVSILTLIDGNGDMPGFDLSLAPHPDDKADAQAQGENWYEPGMVINYGVMLHEEFYE